MKNKKIYCIADVNFEMHYKSEYVGMLCKDYEVNNQEKPEFSIDVSKSDIEVEMSKSEEVFPEYAYESLALYRKLCEKMLDYDTFLFHCSAVEVDGKAFVFSAPSGTGKSTHTKMWREYFGSRAVMINDDKPLIQIKKDAIYVCGTPWCGKHGIQTNKKVPIQGICFLQRGKENKIRQISVLDAYPNLYKQTYQPIDKKDKMLKTLSLIRRLTERIPFYEMQCNISKQAAEIAWNAMKD